MALNPHDDAADPTTVYAGVGIAFRSSINTATQIYVCPMEAH